MFNSAGVSETIDTHNVAQSRREFAKDVQMGENELDFIILNKSKPYEDDQGNVRRIWSICFQRKADRHWMHPHEIFLDTEQDQDVPSQINLIFSAKSHLYMQDPGLQDILLEEIDKLLALKGIVYGIVPRGKMRSICTMIMEHFESQGASRQSYPIAFGQPKKDGHDSRVSYHFDKYDQVGTLANDGSMDFARKNFTQFVNANTKIMTYYRPQRGEPGIDPYGQVQPQYIGQEREQFPFKNVSNNLQIIDRLETIEVHARKTGYFYVDRSGRADITDEINVQGEVNIGVTGDIYFREERKDVSVENQGVYNEAIGAGRVVEGENVVIKGNVAAGARVYGATVVIEGNVQRGANIRADRSIKLHNGGGTVEAPEIHMQNFQNGDIIAEKLVIDGYVLNASIWACNLQVRGQMRNVRLIAAGPEVELGVLKGADNLIRIDPLEVPATKRRIDALDTEAHSFDGRISQLQETVRKLVDSLRKQRPKIEKLREQIRRAQKEGTRLPAPIKMVVATYQQDAEKLEIANRELQDLSNQQKAIETRREEILERARKTRIFIQGIEAHNRIQYFEAPRPHLVENDWKSPVRISYSEQRHVRIERA